MRLLRCLFAHRKKDSVLGRLSNELLRSLMCRLLSVVAAKQMYHPGDDVSYSFHLLSDLSFPCERHQKLIY